MMRTCFTLTFGRDDMAELDDLARAEAERIVAPSVVTKVSMDDEVDYCVERMSYEQTSEWFSVRVTVWFELPEKEKS